MTPFSEPTRRCYRLVGNFHWSDSALKFSTQISSNHSTNNSNIVNDRPVWIQTKQTTTRIITIVITSTSKHNRRRTINKVVRNGPPMRRPRPREVRAMR